MRKKSCYQIIYLTMTWVLLDYTTFFVFSDFIPHQFLIFPEPWSGEDFEKEALNRGVGLAAAERFIVGQTPLPKAVLVSLFGPRNLTHLQKGLTTITDILHGIPGTPRELI